MSVVPDDPSHKTKVTGDVQCKSPHYYHLKDLFPLVRTTFEGVPTWRPYNWTVMMKEYNPNALKGSQLTRYGDRWKFNDTLGMWAVVHN